MRLVSGCYNAFATPFILDEVRLFFHPKSIEHLLAISRHPVTSKLVKSLLYQPDMLQKLESKKEWEEGIFDPRNIPKIPLRPPTGANYDEFHTYILALKEFRRKPLHSLTREQLKIGYIKCQELCKSQQDHRRARYGSRELAKALAGLPNLETCVILVGHVTGPAPYELYDFFNPGLQEPCGDVQGHAAGLPQLRSIYDNAFSCGLKLQSFVGGDISWQLFTSPKKDLAKFASVVSGSQNFCLHLSTGYNAYKDGGNSQVRQCRRYLRNGRIRDSITQAKELEFLRIQTDWSEPISAVDLKNVVGNFTWTRLTSRFLARMETSAEDLLSFFQRHAAMLQTCHPDTMGMTSGCWVTALPRIRSCLKHTDDVLLEGILTSCVPLGYYDLGDALSEKPTLLADKERTDVERHCRLGLRMAEPAP